MTDNGFSPIRRQLGSRWLKGGAVLVVLLAILSAGCSSGANSATSPTTSPSTGTGVGQLAPDFTLSGLDGQRYQLSQLRGKAIVLNFWASWCDPCRMEMPLIEAQYQRYQEQGLLVLGVNVGEDAETVQRFVRQYTLTFPALLDPATKITDTYRVMGYPTTYFIDANGVINARYIGQMSESILVDGIQRALGH